MRSLIESTIVPKLQDSTYDTVIGLLENVADHEDKLFNVIERVVPTKDGVPVPEAGYTRFNHGLRQTYTDPVTGSSWDVPGVIVAVTTNVLRTEGVVVDALLGQGEGLDDYSRGLQQAAVTERVLRNQELEQAIAERKQVAGIVTDKDGAAADVYEKVHPPTPASLELTVGTNGNGNTNGVGRTG
jgi:hypothetical protein